MSLLASARFKSSNRATLNIPSPRIGCYAVDADAENAPTSTKVLKMTEIECTTCETTPPGFFDKYRGFLLSRGMIIAFINTTFLILGFALEWTGNKTLANASFIVSAVVGGAPIYWLAINNVFRRFDMTAGVMVSIAMTAALIIGEYSAMALVAFMMIIGDALEEFTKARADMALKELNKLVPEVVTVRMGGEDRVIPLSQVKPGDVALIRPGARIPVDGSVVSGAAAVDQSAITGESMPVDVAAGGRVYAGTLCQTGSLEVNVTGAGKDSTLGQMIHLVEEAQHSQAPIQRVANKYANYFAPTAVLIAIAAYFITGDIIRSITILIVICPCVLVLATPTAVVAAIGNTAKKGVLVKNGAAMEQVGKIDVVAFDKTGTVTFGEPKLLAVEPLKGHDEAQILLYAASAERSSEHPIAKAVVKAARERGIEVPIPTDFEATPGHGVKATVNGKTIQIGARLLESAKVKMTADVTRRISDAESKGQTAIPIALDGKVAGVFYVADTVRPESRNAVSQIKKLGVSKVLLISGDNRAVAEGIGRELGVDEVHSETLPQRKLDIIKELQAKGHRVAFVGDGVNDAPALAAADIGIAMGSIGTAVAMETADIVLLKDDVGQIPYVLELSQATMSTIKKNIVFSMTMNVTSVILSGLGVFGPVVGAMMHEVAAVPVIANSARLITRKPGKRLET